ncbi:hypothetical protein JW930_05290 [Candidatus Woesearchaeota archaeon]|nr:hypothetical protein [Candidatus Woesearchaeota archaeon]
MLYADITDFLEQPKELFHGQVQMAKQLLDLVRHGLRDRHNVYLMVSGDELRVIITEMLPLDKPRDASEVPLTIVGEKKVYMNVNDTLPSLRFGPSTEFDKKQLTAVLTEKGNKVFFVDHNSTPIRVGSSREGVGGVCNVGGREGVMTTIDLTQDPEEIGWHALNIGAKYVGEATRVVCCIPRQGNSHTLVDLIYSTYYQIPPQLNPRYASQAALAGLSWPQTPRTRLREWYTIPDRFSYSQLIDHIANLLQKMFQELNRSEYYKKKGGGGIAISPNGKIHFQGCSTTKNRGEEEGKWYDLMGGEEGRLVPVEVLDLVELALDLNWWEIGGDYNNQETPITPCFYCDRDREAGRPMRIVIKTLRQICRELERYRMHKPSYAPRKKEGGVGQEVPCLRITPKLEPEEIFVDGREAAQPKDTIGSFYLSSRTGPEDSGPYGLTLVLSAVQRPGTVPPEGLSELGYEIQYSNNLVGPTEESFTPRPGEKARITITRREGYPWRGEIRVKPRYLRSDGTEIGTTPVWARVMLYPVWEE